MKSPDDELSELRGFQQFLDAAIHNLRAALRGIAISAGLIGRVWTVRFDEQANAHLEAILDGAAKIENLSKSLGEYSMALLPGGTTSVELPIGYALQTALAALKTQISESNASVHAEALPLLLVSHEQLTVLFRCLISNALVYRGPEAPRIEIKAVQHEGDWRFTCRDNGIGIAPQYHQQVFEPFQRLEAGARGVGLGLTICKKIIESHSGRIWLESAEGTGTTVVFTLPSERLSEGAAK